MKKGFLPSLVILISIIALACSSAPKPAPLPLTFEPIQTDQAKIEVDSSTVEQINRDRVFSPGDVITFSLVPPMTKENIDLSIFIYPDGPAGNSVQAPPELIDRIMNAGTDFHIAWDDLYEYGCIIDGITLAIQVFDKSAHKAIFSVAVPMNDKALQKISVFYKKGASPDIEEITNKKIKLLDTSEAMKTGGELDIHFAPTAQPNLYKLAITVYPNMIIDSSIKPLTFDPENFINYDEDGLFYRISFDNLYSLDALKGKNAIRVQLTRNPNINEFQMDFTTVVEKIQAFKIGFLEGAGEAKTSIVDRDSTGLALNKGGYIEIEPLVKPIEEYEFHIFRSNTKLKSDGYLEYTSAIMANCLNGQKDALKINYTDLEAIHVLSNGHILKISAINPINKQTEFTTEITMKREFQYILGWPDTFGSLFQLPALAQFEGTFADFTVTQFSPSITATAVQWNTPWNFPTNIKLDLIVSVSAITGEQNAYSMISGPAIDFDGMVQISECYRFAKKDWVFVLGFNLGGLPEVFPIFFKSMGIVPNQ